MAAEQPQRVLLLPERRRFAGQPIAAAIAKILGRSDRLAAADAGEKVQLLRYFQLVPRAWPMAAITRQFDVGDAAVHAWLRADPVFVRPDVGGARLMAWGNLGLSADEAEAFLKPLKPLFGDSGFPISASRPEQWVLMLPREAKLPAFSHPLDGLGEDLLGHLPDGPEGRRWRSLLNEAQILLHNHPRNAERIAAGLPPVNSLWFWGGGVLPDAVVSGFGTVVSDDPELQALAQLAPPQEGGRTLIDCRRERDWHVVEAKITATLQAPGASRSATVLDFSDGQRWSLTGAQRWRFWRTALGKLEP